MAVETDILPPRYRDLQEIGRGGMGEIYRATDDALGRDVAIKLLAGRYARDEAVRDRFKREALTAARVSGEPNVVTIFDVGDWNDRPYIVMEYLPGGSLEDVIRRDGAVAPELALRWLEEAGRAIDAAHEHGIVHRDVKPGNLLLDRDGRVSVADFGIASAAGLDSLTRTGTVLGTAGYLAPEQARGERATPASDRYALAVLAFELLTGTRPFQGDTPAAEAGAHVHAPIPSPTARNAALPQPVDDVFQRALAKNPEARYATCADFVSDLRDALGRERVRAPAAVETAVAAAPTVPYGARRTRSWWPLVAAGLVVAALGAIVAAALLAGEGDEGGTTGAPEPRLTTVVRTAPGTTVTQTVTAPAAEETEPPPQEDSGKSGAQLNDEGFALMQEGRYEEALPLFQEAVAKLSGTGERVEAFALYNLAYTRLQLGDCGGDIPDLLKRSEQIQGHRSEIDAAQEQYEEQCD
jgi:serine/threonine-protein kinase